MPPGEPAAPTECTACGVCCFSTLPQYARVFGVDWDRMDDRARSFTEFIGNRCFMRMEDGRCSALLVDPAPSFLCAIYEQRPDVCRSLERGSGTCRGERHEKGERPLLAVERLMNRSAKDPDARFMREALREAAEAGEARDVPVGAVVVDATGAIVGRGRNRREADQDPTAHAEIEALRRASAALGHWRLEGATVFVTLEPCPMCAGALVNARVARLVYGCADPKAGAVGTLFTIGRDTRLNHRFEVTSGVLAEECAALLKEFFARLRTRSAA